MSEQEREWMERYIYQVVRRLPKAQRGEVEMELRELISDMFEEKGSMEDVLAALGNPAVFAGQYRDGSRCLIGPEYYDRYVWLLKIVLICVSVTVPIVSVISGVLELRNTVLPEIVYAAASVAVDAVVSTAVACMSAFGGLTLVFAVLERQKTKWELRLAHDSANRQDGRTAWTPGQLPPVPVRKAEIGRGDSAVSLVFILLLALLLIFWPQLFSVFFKDGGSIVSVPFFNLAQWEKILPLLLIGLAAGFVDEMIRLITGFYCRAVMIGNILCGLLQIACAAVALKALPFWNTQFVAEVQAYASVDFPFGEWLCAHWDTGLLSSGILLLIVAATLLEIGVTVYKTLRYGSRTDIIAKNRKVMNIR